MANSTWEIASTSPESGTVDFRLDSGDLPGTPRDWSVTKRTLTYGVSAGVELVEIDNGRMKITVIASRGMGIWAVECAGQRLGWRSPVRGPVHPRFVPLSEPMGSGWLEGFDELMVRCGLESNGSAVFDSQGRLLYPLHGKIANRPARSLQVSIDDARGTISLRGIVDETRFHHQKLRLDTTLTTAFGSTSFGWQDEVQNLGGAPAKMQMLYHINVGEPLLIPGSRLIAPIRSVSPHDRYPEDAACRDYRLYPIVGSPASQQSFFFDLLADADGRTQILLERPERDSGVAIRFNRSELPCFTLWRNNAPAEDGYVTGLEPGTNFPNPRSFEEPQGRVVSLPVGGAWRTNVELDWLMDQRQVDAAHAECRRLQGNTVPEIYDSPRPEVSAKA
jgi:hypothetical protein